MAEPTGNPRLDFALAYIEWGVYVLPCCWPDADGNCACGNKRHTKRGGKAPLLRNGVHGSSNDPEVIRGWWKRWPNANVAIDLLKSNLIGIGPDSPETLEYFQGLGLPPTATVQSGGGEGHHHYYYQRPTDIPIDRINKPGDFDLHIQGYFVAPPSLHASGRRYEWLLSYDAYPKPSDLPWPAKWTVDMIFTHFTQKKEPPAKLTGDEKRSAQRVAHDDLRANAQDWWSGARFVPNPDKGGAVDRSKTLIAISRMLAQHGYSRPDIILAIEDRDRVLPGMAKYANRGDRAVRYAEVVDMALTGLPPRGGREAPPPFDDDGPWEADPHMGPPGHDDEHPTAKGRKGEWYMARGKFSARLEELGLDGEFSPSSTEVGKVSILTENPHLFLSKELCADYIGRLFSNKERLQSRIMACGHKLGMDCEDHGERYRTTRTCKTDFHGGCPTDTTNKLARLDGMEDMEGQRQYREVWMRSYLTLVGHDVDKWADDLQRQISTWSKQIQRISKRKLMVGRIVARAASFYMGRISRAHWKVMLREEYPGELDHIIEELCKIMDADVMAENAYHSGESALLQLMENSSIGLVGMDDEEDPDLFYAYYQATKRRHMFQSMGNLQKQVKALPQPEAPRCDVEGCGKPLFPRPISDEEEVLPPREAVRPQEVLPRRELVRQEALF